MTTTRVLTQALSETSETELEVMGSGKSSEDKISGNVEVINKDTISDEDWQKGSEACAVYSGAASIGGALGAVGAIAAKASAVTTFMSGAASATACMLGVGIFRMVCSGAVSSEPATLEERKPLLGRGPGNQSMSMR